MSGQDGSRGYLYQSIISMLEALNDENWDKIYVEFKTMNDKVDIALSLQEKIKKTIQVKSSINLFTKKDIEKWLLDLINDFPSQEYVLYLIGNCNLDANTLIKSLDKHKNKNLDKESEKALETIDSKLLNNNITISCTTFDKNNLASIVRDHLNKYISSQQFTLSHDGLDLITKAFFYTFNALSTKGEYLSKETFNNQLFKWVEINSGDHLTQVNKFSKHKIMFYDKNTKKSSPEAKALNINNLYGYHQIINSHKNKIIELIDNIKKYNLESIDSPQLSINAENDQLPSSSSEVTLDDNIKNFINLSRPVEKYLEKNNDEKDDLIKSIKEITNIDIDRSFFYLGQLKEKTQGMFPLNQSSELIGTDDEINKYHFLDDLEYEIYTIELVNHFIDTFSNYSAISLIIKNISAFSDSNLNIKIYLPKSVKLFNPEHYELDEVITCFVKHFAEKDGIIEKVFKVAPDSIVTMDEKKYTFDSRDFKIQTLPFSNDHNCGFTTKDFYEILTNNTRQKIYNDDTEYNILEYKLNELNANQNKFLGNYILISSIEEDVEIKYSITSKSSDGSINGVLNLQKNS